MMYTYALTTEIDKTYIIISIARSEIIRESSRLFVLHIEMYSKDLHG